jgi:acetyl esterase/lipase
MNQKHRKYYNVAFILFVWINSISCQAQIYDRYGFEIKPDNGEYKLSHENLIRKLNLFNVDSVPSDMYVPYGYIDKIRQADFEKCRTVSAVFKQYPNHPLVIEADLPESGKKPYPYMVWIHGGGWNSGDCNMCKRISTFFASHGIAGIRISYSFLSDGSTFRDTKQDVEDALKYIKERQNEWNLDSVNMGFGGISAGGHLSSYMAMVHPECKLLISYSGVYDLENIEEGFAPDKNYDGYFGKGYERRLASPVNYVQENPPYSILLFSGGDVYVDKKQVYRFEQALKEKNGNVEIIYKDYYTHTGLFFGTDVSDDIMLHLLKKAEEILK